MARLNFAVLEVKLLRALAAGDPEMHRQMLDTLNRHFPTPDIEEARPGSLLSQIGPIFARPLRKLTAPGRPLPSDVAAIVEGRVLPRARHQHAWAIVWAWLNDSALATTSLNPGDLALRMADDTLRTMHQPALNTLIAPRVLGLRLPDIIHRRSGWASYAETLRVRPVLHAGSENAELLGEIAEVISSLPLGRGIALVSSIPTSR